MIEESYTVEMSSIGEPRIFLGNTIGKWYYHDGSYAWTIRSK